ncbi:hypothetical protein JL720_1895 [Aureococcus anophagefferens]|nr:hypothetical protein JL720_1895 [Aureococcus anophagefferens]
MHLSMLRRARPLLPRRALASSNAPRIKAPIGWGGLALVGAAGGGLAVYYNVEKEKRQTAAAKKQTTYGVPSLGGPWTLVDAADGAAVTDAEATAGPERASDFDPRVSFLTGTPQQLKAAAKAYRVYSSISDDDKDADDYLIDHSIVLYFLGPDGKFLDFFTQATEPPTIVEKICAHHEALK